VARLAGCGRSACPRHCRLQRRDVSSKTSRAVPPLRAPGLRSRIPTDDAGPKGICIFRRPRLRDRWSCASARHLVRRDGELVALARPDHELALAAVGDLARDRIDEEAVLQAIDDEPFEPVEGLADLPALGALERRNVLRF